ncbi:uncharacterized protein Dana_GF10280 [Drosophila ananassae]|uniref:DUF4729 domain-containing protein n=1 Tax=Drosophila ananassae TaxID=7217 RepID=B3M8J0_DROAN|nr:uncharacterized protein LOC6493152 [Drosophila ananassae]EDV39964.1 uncharacterized protein Dana_GF10280 [Drosophila ananassae]
MFECTHCNRRRSKLSLRHGEIQSLGKEYIEGATSWCSACKKLRFFMKRKKSSDINDAEGNKLKAVDSIDSIPTEKKEKEKIRVMFNSRSTAQNQQAASLAVHLNNWAVQAMDPPSRGQSFTRFPAMKPIKDRVREGFHDEPVPPPFTPLNLLKREKSVERLRKVVSSRTKHNKNPSPSKEPKVELRGIERLRATAPPHLARTGVDRFSLPPTNLPKDTPKIPKNINLKDRTQPKDATAKNPTIDETKRLHHRNGAEELPGTSKGHHRRNPTEHPTSGPAEASSSKALLRKLEAKRRQMTKLTGMRSKIEEEYEATRREVQTLEFQRRRISRQRREKGGSHFPMPHMAPIAVSSLSETAINNKLYIKQNAKVMETLLENVRKSQEKPVRRKNGKKTSRTTPASRCTSSDSSGTLESATDIDSYPTTEEEVDTGYICLPDILNNPLLKMNQADFYTRPSKPRSDMKRSKKLEVPEDKYILASSAQRASLQGAAPDPQLVERLKKKLIESARTGIPPILEPPNDHFSTVACTKEELIVIMDKNPQLGDDQKPRELNVSRSPIHCPDHDCKRLSFISDLNKHLLLEHRALTMERIGVRQTKTFFLDSTMVLLNKPKCQMLYMVRDKIIDTQGDDLKDLLPVLVMTARANLAEALAPTKGHSSDRVLKRIKAGEDREVFLIWLTSIIPRDMCLMGTLSLWSTTGFKIIDCLSVNTSHMYDIRAPLDMGTICRSPSTLMLPMQMISKMTDKGANFLVVQVKVY